MRIIIVGFSFYEYLTMTYKRTIHIATYINSCKRLVRLRVAGKEGLLDD